jgi:hypothetical protein
MNFYEELEKLGLNPSNSVVIGSGILNELGIRESKDIDVVVDQKAFDKLSNDPNFSEKSLNGNSLLVDDIFEIMTHDCILGKNYSLSDFMPESTVLNNVRYIKLEFLLKIKESWVADGTVRPKDLTDIKLIKENLTNKK